jgi:hypothetical protein
MGIWKSPVVWYRCCSTGTSLYREWPIKVVRCSLSCRDSGSGLASRDKCVVHKSLDFVFLCDFKIFPARASRHRLHASASVYHIRVPKKTIFFFLNNVFLVLPFILYPDIGTCTMAQMQHLKVWGVLFKSPAIWARMSYFYKQKQQTKQICLELNFQHRFLLVSRRVNIAYL